MTRLLLVFVIFMLGCGGGGDPLYPASGKVQFPDGAPLTAGWVVFESSDPALSATARGELKPDGSFELSTREPGDGVRAGTYHALVGVPTPDGDARGARATPPIDPKFSSFATSGFQFTVTDQPEKNQFELQVTRPPATKGR